MGEVRLTSPHARCMWVGLCGCSQTDRHTDRCVEVQLEKGEWSAVGVGRVGV